MATRCYGCMKQKQSSPICEHCGYDERTQNQAHQLPIGTLLRSQYRIGRVLGQGGFGITYLGFDENLNIPVAIKEYFPTGMVSRNTTFGNAISVVQNNQAYEKCLDRFIREAQTLARLDQAAGIVNVKSSFLKNGTAYIVMEYLQGMDLRCHIQKLGRPMTPQETLPILYAVMDALQEVHEAGLVHRDLSPDNIMLMKNGRVKLLDFGTARDLEDGAQSTFLILKQGFAPLEQYVTKGNLGPWTDVYALCATAYYCMTRQVPPSAAERMQQPEEKISFSAIPGLSENQAAVFNKGMALYIKARYVNVAVLKRDLASDLPPTEKILVPVKISQAPTEKILISEKTQPPLPQTEPVLDPLPQPPVIEPIPESGDEKPVPQYSRKPQVGRILGIIALILLGVWLLLPRGEGGQTTSTNPSNVQGSGDSEASVSEHWRDNVLKGNPNIEENNPETELYNLGINLSEVQTVTFLDSTAAAPFYARDVSEAGDGSVLGWVVSDRPFYDVYFAADGGINGRNACCLFRGFQNLTEIRFNGVFHTDEAENMAQMFAYCYSLENLDLSGWNTGAVINTINMFMSCGKLREVNFSGWDTGKVQSINGMFTGCTSLKVLDLSGWNTVSLQSMKNSFQGCVRLEELDVSGWNTSNVVTMHITFGSCKSLKSLDLSDWDTSKVTIMYGLFNGCGEITALNLGDWEVDSIENYESFMDAGILYNGHPWQELFVNAQ